MMNRSCIKMTRKVAGSRTTHSWAHKKGKNPFELNASFLIQVLAKIKWSSSPETWCRWWVPTARWPWRWCLRWRGVRAARPNTGSGRCWARVRQSPSTRRWRDAPGGSHLRKDGRTDCTKTIYRRLRTLRRQGKDVGYHFEENHSHCRFDKGPDQLFKNHDSCV